MAMGSPASPRNVGAVQPPRAARLLHTRRTLSKPASSSYRRFLVLCSFTTLVAASSPRYHFVCLSRGGPSRRRARCLTRVRTLFSPPCVHISIACSALSLAYRSLPRCMPRCMPPPLLLPRRAHPRMSLARDDRIRRITTCVFYEPRRTALAKTNARADFRAALIALGGQSAACVDFRVPDVVTLSLFALCRSRGDRHPRLHRAHILRARQGTMRGCISRESHGAEALRRVVMVRLQYTVGPLCVNFNYGTPCEFMRHFAYFTGVAVEFGRSRSGTYRAPRMCALTHGRRHILIAALVIARRTGCWVLRNDDVTSETGLLRGT